MTTRRLATMGLLSFLVGCFIPDKPSPFTKQNGQWLYLDTPVDGSDAASFEVLDDHYAKDAKRVYYGETYRKGQEYWSIKRTRIEVIANADAPSFVLIDKDFARDRSRIYHEGAAIPVRDPATFEVIPGRPFTRDSKVGYYNTWEIRGSDGASFVALDDHYAKDSKHVFFCDVEVPPGSATPQLRLVTLDDVDVGSFTALDYDYARDARRVYHQGRVIATQFATFEVLDDHYARTDKAVFFKGDIVKGANAATFTVEGARDTGAAPPE